MFSFTIPCTDGAHYHTRWRTDVVCKCDLELVFLKCWAFGEVKKIRRPAGVPKTGKKLSKKTEEPKMKPGVIPGNVDVENVIPHNVPSKSDHIMRK